MSSCDVSYDLTRCSDVSSSGTWTALCIIVVDYVLTAVKWLAVVSWSTSVFAWTLQCYDRLTVSMCRRSLMDTTLSTWKTQVQPVAVMKWRGRSLDSQHIHHPLRQSPVMFSWLTGSQWLGVLDCEASCTCWQQNQSSLSWAPHDVWCQDSAQLFGHNISPVLT